MLRAAISGVAIAFVAIALAATIVAPANLVLLVVALLFALGCLFERRYHAGRAGLSPDAHFRLTDERFIDPETGQAMIVWADPATGERRYVKAGEPPAPIA